MKEKKLPKGLVWQDGPVIYRHKLKTTEREKAIYEWKCKGKGISWARWCSMVGIKQRLRCPAPRSGASVARPDAQKG